MIDLKIAIENDKCAIALKQNNVKRSEIGMFIYRLEKVKQELMNIKFPDTVIYKKPATKPVCPRCWSIGKIQEDCPDCNGTGEKKE